MTVGLGCARHEMASDYNAPASSRFNAGIASSYNARRRRVELFFGAAQSGGAINFPAGIIGDSLQFYAFSPTFPMPSFRWNGGLIGEPDDGWGRSSFTIRYWWKAGSWADVGSSSPLGESIKGQFRTGYFDTFFIQPNLNTRKIDFPVGGATIVYIPTIRFGVWTGAVFEEVSLHFFQSPETSGGSTVGLPTGGIVRPLIEMTEDSRQRQVG